ncbi:hypothetical protein EBZ37_10760, partial [bacterium]|nr:hypothetical protein [bacterium]
RLAFRGCRHYALNLPDSFLILPIHGRLALLWGLFAEPADGQILCPAEGLLFWFQPSCSF